MYIFTHVLYNIYMYIKNVLHVYMCMYMYVRMYVRIFPIPQVLRRGANVNDKDGLSDLSLLHFACKSGATGVGNVSAALNLVNSLLNKV